MNPQKVVALLLSWFRRNARDLPWRRTHDPYAIWVSEIMLQQTQVKTVVPYWERWMKALPTLASLARAKPQKIHKLWEGLGYYTRVRNMQKAARLIMSKHDGRFPSDFEDILDLPGIGRYTAGAIASIAFNQPRPILDGNVIRVLTRLFGIDGNPRERIINDRLWDLAHDLVMAAHSDSSRISNLKSQISNNENDRFQTSNLPNGRSQNANACCSHFNQSLMELGALVCTPRQPVCESCPLQKVCVAHKQGRTGELPRILPRQPVTHRRFVAFIVHDDNRFLVRQRPAGVVNAHLWEFPNVEVSNNDGDSTQACRQALGLTGSKPKLVCTIRHSITRYRIRMDVFQIESRRKKFSQEHGRWLTQLKLQQLAFASAHKRILACLSPGTGQV